MRWLGLWLFLPGCLLGWSPEPYSEVPTEACDSFRYDLEADATSGLGSELGKVLSGEDNSSYEAEILGQCGSASHAAIYTWKAAWDGTYRFSTAGSGPDTVLAVEDALRCFCNDDAVGLDSEVEFPAVAGQQLTVAIGALSDTEGAYELEIERTTAADDDDFCHGITSADTSTVTSIEDATQLAGTIDGTSEATNSGACGDVRGGVLYEWNATTSSKWSIKASSVAFDSVVVVRPEDGTACACNDDIIDSNINIAEVEFETTAGESFHIMVGSLGEGEGEYGLSITLKE